jgi:serine/threonine-protein kinase
MGIVYRARDLKLKRPVAIKVLPPELAYRSDIRTRFLREAETAAQLSHPNIVPIYSVGEQDGIVFFVMEYVDGENLAIRLQRQGRLEPQEVRRILTEVARALAYAHEQGVIHRDIKPDNILLQRRDGRVMVTDFGIARAVTERGDPRLTATGMAIGTPAYMSPEQSAGERNIDGRSDLYSLGVVAYQMLVGVLPFDAPSTPALLVKHLSEDPEPIEKRRRDVPEELARAVMICLEKSPEDRFPSAAALVTALETCQVPERIGPTRRPVPLGPAGTEAAEDSYQPSLAELERWQARPVVHFRSQLAKFAIVNSVIVVVSIFTRVDLMFITAFWSVGMAFGYAKLWAADYDWRDVLRQPRDRLFFDLVAEWADNVRALWDSGKRAELRARARVRLAAPPSGRSASGSAAARVGLERDSLSAASSTSAVAGTVRRAARLQDEILSLVREFPKRQRGVVAAVPAGAKALYQRIVGLAGSLSELERALSSESLADLEREIAALEAEANPLDRDASDRRVHRLAQLRRRRRAVLDIQRRREETSARLESCYLALENMRLDLLRLKAGEQPAQTITLAAERAMELAREVDSLVYASEQMRQVLANAGEQMQQLGSKGAARNRT